MRKKVASILLLILLVIGLGLLWTGYSEKVRVFNPTVEARLDQLMQSSLEKYNAPGMILGVWVPGRGNYFKALGTANLATRADMDPTNRFRIGSLTKTFTATVVLQLIDEGRLGLDDSIEKYTAHVPQADKITIRQLLNMTSGVYDYTELFWLEEQLAENRFGNWVPEELVAAAVTHKPNFEPGQGYHYSNTNYVLLGMIVEKLTGDRLNNQIKMRITDKLRLTNTFFPSGNKIIGNYISGYFDEKENGKLIDWTEQDVSRAWASGAIVSNVYDLKTYIKALGEGVFLSRELQHVRLSDWVDIKSKQISSLQYGLGIFTLGGFVGYNGELPGYVTLAMYNPQNKATIVFMLNTQPAQAEAALMIFQELLEIVFP
ncbi:hypothetical protein A3H38_04560 [candidate division WOR-1 bacterium RIFCSPLOWO2_02_FULL_46_20]|uniref:Beta-lactamase-related domain-containing protein n=1 Tax=candidate division WOR-1 bacterium RIFCSPLOWO2_02_FULL_46_20 TaxID=1802567 RepID=A0A1F4R488_UNCSA|nr:MAG: hypothetical protein A3J44_03555 [candidate division WOR-1 bacterium RIFCSPHIGHO2_02_FULL_45_12]OGC02997.1 MAG: hypothetical protein A3H38_04560 [candidate division WOR-1 bacterium RIFCSPLOWO2_02_FULL_46_20]